MNHEDLPKTVKRTHQYHGYDVQVVSHTEYIDEDSCAIRRVVATTAVDGNEIVSRDSRRVASPPGITKYIVSLLTDYEVGWSVYISEADHVREVLEDLKAKIDLVEERGSVDNPSEVDAAIDQVFGDQPGDGR